MGLVPGPDGVREPPSTELPQIETFAMFFRREFSDAVALSWMLTGSRETAEDVVQDAMTDMYRRWDDIASIADPRAYLRRACANKAASSFRRRAAEIRALLRLSSQTKSTVVLPDESEAFWTAVRELPRRQAQAVALFYGCDMSLDQVADTLGMANGTVKAHLNRARTRLAQRLAPERSEEGTTQ